MPNIDHEGRKETDKLTLLKGGGNFLLRSFLFVFFSLLIITTASIKISGGQLLLNQKNLSFTKEKRMVRPPLTETFSFNQNFDHDWISE